MTRRGRPMKYAGLILSLADDELWNHRKVADFAVAAGVITKEERRRAVDALGRFVRLRLDHIPPDKIVVGWPCWFGHRWKAAVPEGQRPEPGEPLLGPIKSGN